MKPGHPLAGRGQWNAVGDARHVVDVKAAISISLIGVLADSQLACLHDRHP
jgi:hypothetical protein